MIHMEVTFKGGEKRQIKIHVGSNEYGTEVRGVDGPTKSIEVFAMAPENWMYDHDSKTPAKIENAKEAEDVGHMLLAVMRSFAQNDVEDFDKNPLIGISSRYPIGEENDDDKQD